MTENIPEHWVSDAEWRSDSGHPGIARVEEVYADSLAQMMLEADPDNPLLSTLTLDTEVVEQRNHGGEVCVVTERVVTGTLYHPSTGREFDLGDLSHEQVAHLLGRPVSEVVSMFDPSPEQECIDTADARRDIHRREDGAGA
jgi:hypothetical protein